MNDRFAAIESRRKRREAFIGRDWDAELARKPEEFELFLSDDGRMAKKSAKPGMRIESLRPRNWRVVKANDDGRKQEVRGFTDYDRADKYAGKLIDQQSDYDVGAGWNYLVERISRKKGT